MIDRARRTQESASRSLQLTKLGLAYGQTENKKGGRESKLVFLKHLFIALICLLTKPNSLSCALKESDTLGAIIHPMLKTLE